MDRVSQSHKCFMLIFVFSSVGLRFPASDICSINYTKDYAMKKIHNLNLKMLPFFAVAATESFYVLISRFENCGIKPSVTLTRRLSPTNSLLVKWQRMPLHTSQPLNGLIEHSKCFTSVANRGVGRQLLGELKGPLFSQRTLTQRLKRPWMQPLVDLFTRLFSRPMNACDAPGSLFSSP